MIIDESYDKSLWIVTHSDKKNRDMIVDFINSIPDSLYTRIQASADMVSRCKRENISYSDRPEKELHGSVITKDKIMYWYLIDPYNFGMTLGYSIFDGKDYDDMFEMTLYPYSQPEIDYYERSLMARVCDVSNGGYSFAKDEVKYVMTKSKFGFIVCLLSSNKPLYKRVNLAKVPQDIEFSDLRKTNRLVLRKTLKKCN